MYSVCVCVKTDSGPDDSHSPVSKPITRSLPSALQSHQNTLSWRDRRWKYVSSGPLNTRAPPGPRGIVGGRGGPWFGDTSAMTMRFLYTSHVRVYVHRVRWKVGCLGRIPPPTPTSNRTNWKTRGWSLTCWSYTHAHTHTHTHIAYIRCSLCPASLLFITCSWCLSSSPKPLSLSFVSLIFLCPPDNIALRRCITH